MSLNARTEAVTPHAVASIGAADAQIVPSAADKGVTTRILTNTHATQTVDLSLGGTAVSGQGPRLAAGATLTITGYSGEIRGIASGASTPVGYCEF